MTDEELEEIRSRLDKEIYNFPGTYIHVIETFRKDARKLLDEIERLKDLHEDLELELHEFREGYFELEEELMERDG